MGYIVALILCISAIVVLAVPIIRRSHLNTNRNDLEQQINNLRWDQEQIYDDIKSLVLDHDIENISEPEYLEKFQQYRTNVAEKIRQEDQLKRQRVAIQKYLETQVDVARQNIRGMQDK